jgi:hypothetical protein
MTFTKELIDLLSTMTALTRLKYGNLDKDVYQEILKAEAILAKGEPAPPRVLIEISGGVCNNVYADAPIQYKVKDWDNIKEGNEAKPYLDDLSHFSVADTVFSTKELDDKAKEDVEEYVIPEPGKVSYFKCKSCGSIRSVPTSDIAQVGAPICPKFGLGRMNGGCGDESGMTEIEADEYTKEKCEVCGNPLDPEQGDNWDGLCPTDADRVSEYMDTHHVEREAAITAIQTEDAAD